MLERKIAPPIKDAVEYELKLKPYQLHKLSNGVSLYALNMGAEDVLMLEFVFYAGNCFESANLVAATTNYLLKNGTSSKTAFQVNEYFEYHGAYLSRASQHETATITLHCLSKHLSKLLPVIREIITDSVFPEEELDIFKQNSRQRLSVSLKKCDFVGNRLIDSYVYGAQHPYGRFGIAEDYDALQRQQLMDFYDERYRKGACIMFAAGKLPADFEKQVNEYFGDLNLNGNPASYLNVPQPSQEKKVRLSNDPNGVQGAIRMGREFHNRHHPDFQKVLVLNNIFGGFFGSRLMANIREEKGYTYGIHSFIENHIQSSAWMVSTEAGKDVCEETIVEVYKEMQLLRDEEVDAEELSLVKNYMMGTNLGDLDGPFHVIARWKTLILNNLDAAYFDESMNTIRNITAKELQELANKYLAPEEFFELVVI